MDEQDNTPSESPSESVELHDSNENNETPSSQTDDSKPDGWQQVEFTPEQQQRFDRLYKQTKENQRIVSEYRKIAKEQSQVIANLERGQQQIVSHIQQDDYSRAEVNLKAQRDAAFTKGDLASFNAANDQLTKINAQRIYDDSVRKNQPQQQVQQNFQPTPQDLVDNAVEQGEISHDDVNVYKSWASQTDQNGNSLRPWLNTSDMRNHSAAIEGQAVFNNPSFANKSFAEKLNEIDRRMGMANRQNGQSVLGGGRNLTTPRQGSNIKLSPQIEKVAVRTKFAGPGKSDAQHIEAYKTQMAKVRGAK